MDGLFGSLVVDKFSLFFKFLLVGAAALVALVSTDYVKRFQRFQAEYYALVLLSTTGMMLLASTVELITIYIALELTALPIAALAAFLRDGRSTESGLKFLILSAISSAVLLYGMVLVYGFTGTTSLSGIAAQIGGLDLGADTPFGSNALLFGIVLMIAGFGFKIASVPFQMWAPDVYEGSPTPVTAYLSVASKAAGFAVILRVFYMAFSAEAMSLEWASIFAALSVLSMTVGNFVAIRQSNIKRLLAYSTIAHAGYLMVGLAAVASRTPEGQAAAGPSGVLFYLAGYAATNFAAFSTVIAISNRVGSDAIDDFSGMARRAPYLSAVLGFAMISLIGVPPTVGFITKVYIFGAAVDANLEWLAVAGVVQQRRVGLLLPESDQGHVPVGASIRRAGWLRPSPSAGDFGSVRGGGVLWRLSDAAARTRPDRGLRSRVIAMSSTGLIGLVYNSLVPEAPGFVGSLVDPLKIQERCWKSAADEVEVVRDKLESTSLIVVAGGDGTILRTVRAIAPHSIPIVGVNMGRVGFMTELRVEDAVERLPFYMNGDLRIEERMMLEASVTSTGSNIPRVTLHSLNDVVVAGVGVSSLLDVHTEIDGVPLTSFRADAVIVSTATGSTGYALAAGGPILYPEARVMLVQPVAAHTGLRDGLVVPDDSVVELRSTNERQAMVSADGFMNADLQPGDRVLVTRSQQVARFLRASPPSAFYTTLTQRLGLVYRSGQTGGGR